MQKKSSGTDSNTTNTKKFSQSYSSDGIEPKWPVRRKAPHGKQTVYNPIVIESKWQAVWQERKVFSPDLNSAKKPYYNLMMFPYPSAEGLHAGNMYAFTGSDIWGRYQRMKGNDVFEPIGLDGFGIHSENYAIKIGEHPVELSKRTQKRFYAQLQATGNAYDWTRTLETYDPDYYRWTQWLFVQMFKHGLAYRKKAKVNWCPSCKTVLADEQVISGKCERCSSQVGDRQLEQWFFKITDYADRLLSNLKQIDWSDKVKIAQEGWIGRSEGAQIEFKIENSKLKIEVFTTAVDTIFGVTFMVISPEHPILKRLGIPEEHREAISKYIRVYKNDSASKLASKGETLRGGNNDKTGVFTGLYAINPFNNEKVPLWVADYVLMDYGTGIVMGVPGHDARDYEFAKKHNLPIKPVVKPALGIEDKSIKEDGFWDYPEIKLQYADSSVLFNSGEFDGLSSREAKEKITRFIEDKNLGKRKVTYHLRDWLISRQRYWGPPVPMVFCQACADKGDSWFSSREVKTYSEKSKIQMTNSKSTGNWKLEIGNSAEWNSAGWYPVSDEDLPVRLPYIGNFKPTGTGVAPLAQDPSFVKVNCPGCGQPARRETDVSDTFLDSAWYFLRYPSIRSAHSGQVPFDPEITKKWLPVTMYIGGAEHSVLHLMYSRFVTMALHDWGYLDFEEPFTRFYAHGLLIKEGAKMSKSKGNVIVPDEHVKKYGSDTLRAYLMFLSPFDMGGDFRDTGMEGMYKFLRRVWDLVVSTRSLAVVEEEEAKKLLAIMHKTIKRVTQDMESLRYNRALAGIMEYTNSLRELKSKIKSQPRSERGQKSKNGIKCAEWEEALKTLLLLLSPFAPHMTEELYQRYYTGISNNQLSISSKSSNSQVENLRLTGNWPASTKRGEKLETGNFISIHFQPWPRYDEASVQEELIELPVQVNGRLRAAISVEREKAGDQSAVEAKARQNSSVKNHLQGREIKKVVFIPGRTINFVTV